MRARSQQSAQPFGGVVRDSEKKPLIFAGAIETAAVLRGC
jgi:hypothetical protein